MLNNVNIGGIAGFIFGGLGLTMSTNTILEILSIISIALSILMTAAPLVISLFQKIKKAKEDGKITKEEVQEIHDDAKNIVKEVKKKINKEK